MIRESLVTALFTAAFLTFVQGVSVAKTPLPDIKPCIEKTVQRASGVPVPLKKPSLKNRSVSSSFFLKARAVPLEDKTLNPVLSKADAALYKRVFAAQEKGDIQTADTLLAQASNPLLLGHVLYQRYMHPSAYTSRYKELQSWLVRYNDHPGADKIYALAQRKGSSGAGLKEPVRANGVSRVREPTMRPARRYKKASALEKSVQRMLRKGQPDQGLRLLLQDGSTQGLETIEIDFIKAEIAAAFLYNADVEQAYRLATSAAKRSGQHTPKAGWVAGLISWQRKDYERAARFFEIAASSKYSSGWLVSSASYWAARAHMRAGDVQDVSTWLMRGTEYPRTFYGLISTRALGHNFDFNWRLPTFTKNNHDVLVGIPAGARAVALAKAGQAGLAQAELLRVRPQNAEQRTAFLAFAGYAQLPALSMRLASAINAPDDGYYDSALYPLIPWAPKGGYKIDTALLHAIMKQESRFDPYARSGSGASGLMQLMPATARYVAGSKADFIDDPAINLEIGQRYLQDLLKLPSVDGNILYLLIAYNAGPGNLAKWKKRWPDVQDPLLFIELLPASETRNYIEKVLANYWIYRMRARKDIPTLDSIAAGETALYKSGQ
jgi:soluble lytic murein transglycosylase